MNSVPAITFQTYMDIKTFDRLEAARGDVSRSKFITRAVLKELNSQ